MALVSGVELFGFEVFAGGSFHHLAREEIFDEAGLRALGIGDQAARGSNATGATKLLELFQDVQYVFAFRSPVLCPIY
jgi:hypothetical protein